MIFLAMGCWCLFLKACNDVSDDNESVQIRKLLKAEFSTGDCKYVKARKTAQSSAERTEKFPGKRSDCLFIISRCNGTANAIEFLKDF